VALTQIADIVVPTVFTPYVQQLTEEKSRLIQSGALSVDGVLSGMLAGGGLLFNVPSFKDLANTTDNVSTDSESDTIVADFGAGTPNPRLDALPNKTGTSTETAVRLSRNNHWSSSDLAAALAGADPMASIASRVADYWARRLQAAFVAAWNGVIKDNVANDAGDYQNDISAGAYVAGVTDFSAEALIDAALTAGDSMDLFTLVLAHSVVYARMKKNNLIDFIPDSEGRVNIATFFGMRVVVDDGLPNAAGVYDTWVFGAGATRLGVGSPKVATETYREPLAGNGGGQEVLSNRVEWSIHPVGHAFVGTAANGGPGNGTGANQLNAAASWNRVFPERKQIRFARLVTRES